MAHNKKLQSYYVAKVGIYFGKMGRYGLFHSQSLVNL